MRLVCSRSAITKIQAVIIIVVLVVAIVAGVAVYYATRPPPAPPPEKKVKVATLLPGSITDAGWNAQSYVAAQEIAEKEDLDLTVVDELGYVAIDSTLRDFAQKGYDLVFADTVHYQDSVLRVAPDFPETFFLVADGWKFDDLKNVAAYATPQSDAAYLAGILAAGMTKTGKIGVINGMKIPVTIAIAKGFIMGAKRLNPDVKVLYTYTGDWGDLTKGREMALSMIEEGVDVIFTSGDGITLGAIQACSLKGVMAIGSMADQNSLAPDTVISSAVYDKRIPYGNFVRMYKEGKLVGGQGYYWGAADGAAYLAPFHNWEDKVPDNIKAELKRALDEMKAGTLEVPPFAEKEE